MLRAIVFRDISCRRGTKIVDNLSGQASVIDGDTLEIHGNRIRIFGIDAPESDQLCGNEESELYRCGQKASNALYEYIGRRPVECVEVDRDRYKRAVSVCSVGGADIADWHSVAADEDVVSGTAEQEIIAPAADQNFVTVAAIRSDQMTRGI
jgi:nuclease-like protein